MTSHQFVIPIGLRNYVVQFTNSPGFGIEVNTKIGRIVAHEGATVGTLADAIRQARDYEMPPARDLRLLALSS